MDRLSLLKAIFGEDTDDMEKRLPFIDDAISTLDEREQCVLQKRFSGMALKEIGKELLRLSGHASCDGISRERVRQIEARALRKLGHQSRRKILSGEWTSRQMIADSFDQKVPQPPSHELLAKAEGLRSIPIDTIEFSNRAQRAMKRVQINSVGDLVLKTEADILSVKNVGRKTLDEIKGVLLEMNLSLRKS